MDIDRPDLPRGDILIVDDKLPNLRLLSDMLTEQGYKVRGAPSGSMALTAVRSAPPDLVLLDINMPEMNGYEVCQHLKSESQTRDVPVIFISALDEALDKVKAFSVGGVDYITKPFQVEEVLARVQNHLDLRRLQVELQQVNENLERRVEERTAELAQTVAALKEQIAERERAERERAELERQLHQSQKMEALGRLAGGVTHDFNNLLAVIIGYSELLLMRQMDSDSARPKIEQIQQAGERGAALTRQLLAFSRRQVFQPRVLNLNTAVRGIDKMLGRLIGEDIELIARLEPGLGRVKVDPGQIDQVIMNLAVNARDAMPRGGRLTIETTNVEVDEADAFRPPGMKAGSYVMLAVGDTGVGMDAETQARIFEPFFTTKEQGKGTGLGLSTVHGIVSQSGGHVGVESTPGRGTTFRVYLPPVEAEADAAEQPGVTVGDLLGSETVLLVEDETGVRQMICQLLQVHGYTVLEAGSSDEALTICEQHPDPIHLLLTDVVMPRMGGLELAKRLAPYRPETKVLYMSGYLDDTVVHHGLLDSEMTVLQKPFTRDVLMQKVREVLDR